jgi:hypothetical protein
MARHSISSGGDKSHRPGVTQVPPRMNPAPAAGSVKAPGTGPNPGAGAAPVSGFGKAAESARPSMSGGSLPDAERQQRIAERAYMIAEREGFPAGREFEHWLEAEAEVDKAMAKLKR